MSDEEELSSRIKRLREGNAHFVLNESIDDDSSTSSSSSSSTSPSSSHSSDDEGIKDGPKLSPEPTERNRTADISTNISTSGQNRFQELIIPLRSQQRQAVAAASVASVTPSGPVYMPVHPSVSKKRARASSLESTPSPAQAHTSGSSTGGGEEKSNDLASKQLSTERYENEEASGGKSQQLHPTIDKESNSNISKGSHKEGNSNKRRSRSNSWDYNFTYVSRTNHGTNSNCNSGSSGSALGATSRDQETILQWKQRLWPTNALLDFCRTITYCRVEKIEGAPQEHFHLRPWWTLQKTGTSFEGFQSYISKFFLAICEECRVTLDSSIEDNITSSSAKFSSYSERGTIGTTGMTRRFDVIDIVNKDDVVQQNLFLPKLQGANINKSSVRLLRLALDGNDLEKFSSNEGQKGTKDDTHNNFDSNSNNMFWGGDIVALQNDRWSKVCIGLVQCWDPDNDVALGVVARAAGIPVHHQGDYQGSFASSSSSCALDGREVVNVLVCICEDPSTSVSSSSQNGWVNPNEMVQVGDKLIVTSIGNAMTSIRECQALVSVELMNKTLQRLIFNPTEIIKEYDLKHATAEMVQLASSSSSTSPFSSSVPPPICVPLPLWNVLTETFNASQLRAIKAACPRGDLGDETAIQLESKSPVLPITLLQGPPGTGKTKVILGLVSVFLAGALEKKKSGTKINAGASLMKGSQQSQQLTQMSTPLERKKSSIRILICAPSNTAIDEVVYRLKTQGYFDEFGQKRDGKDLNLVRIGNGGALKSSSFFNSSSSNVGAAMNVKKEHGNLNNGWSPTKPIIDDNQHSVSQEVEQASLDYISDSRRQIDISRKNRVRSIMEYRKEILEDAEVVCSTLSGAGSQPLLELAMRIPNFRFDVIIIDEAAQAVEPSALIPFKYNPQVVVMVGDPQQLPATVFSPMAKNANYSQSLFLRLHLAGFPMTMLETQYRMHPRIAEFPSQYFYNGLLKTSTTVNNNSHFLEFHRHQSNMFGPFVFHDISYGKQRTSNGRISNLEEVQYIVDMYTALKKSFPNQMHRKFGIISPYKEQVYELKRAFRGSNLMNRGHEIEISTIDGFQGREKDIVIFSCVRGPTHYSNQSRDDLNSIGFVKDWHRLNVAITRSKYALWIVGNAQVLSSGDIVWKNLVNHARKRGNFIQRRARSLFFDDQFRGREGGRDSRGYDNERDFGSYRSRSYDYDRSHDGYYGRDGELWNQEKYRDNRNTTSNRDYGQYRCKDSEYCRYFQKAGWCKWGDKCKYLHQTDLHESEAIAVRTKNVDHGSADGRGTMCDIVSESIEVDREVHDVVKHDERDTMTVPVSSASVEPSLNSSGKRSRSGSKEIGCGEKKSKDKGKEKDKHKDMICGYNNDDDDNNVNNSVARKKTDVRSRSNSINSAGASKNRHRSRSNSVNFTNKAKRKDGECEKQDFSCIVKNLPQKVEGAELTDYFIINGCAINNNPIKSEINISSTTGKSKGHAIVEFSCAEDQEKALELNGHLWPGTEKKLIIVKR